MLKHMAPGPAPGQNRQTTRGFNRSAQPLNISTLSTPVGGGPAGSGGGGGSGLIGGPPKIHANGGPRMSSFINTTPLTSISSINNKHNHHHNNNNNNPNIYKNRLGAREALTSLGLLCLVSLLLALLSLIFLLKISPGGREPPPLPPGPTSPEDYAIVYDVTLALCALSLSLNLCCLLVCAIQFLFAVKLVRAPTSATGRANKYLQKSSVSRVCAVGGFFISIPIFLTGIILYTFTQFQSTPAIVTSALIGVGIVFCGGAMVHNVFVWQKEKTICVRQQPLNLNLSLSPQLSAITPPAAFMNGHLHMNHNNHNHHHHHHNHNGNGINQHQTTPLSPLTPVTPLSPNHSHISFNHSYVPSFGVRAATATPPTPKIGQTILTTATTMAGGRDASGSVSPGMPTNTLDASNVTTNSLHELSTLV